MVFTGQFEITHGAQAGREEFQHKLKILMLLIIHFPPLFPRTGKAIAVCIPEVIV